MLRSLTCESCFPDQHLYSIGICYSVFITNLHLRGPATVNCSLPPPQPMPIHPGLKVAWDGVTAVYIALLHLSESRCGGIRNTMRWRADLRAGLGGPTTTGCSCKWNQLEWPKVSIDTGENVGLKTTSGLPEIGVDAVYLPSLSPTAPSPDL